VCSVVLVLLELFLDCIVLHTRLLPPSIGGMYCFPISFLFPFFFSTRLLRFIESCGQTDWDFLHFRVASFVTPSRFSLMHPPFSRLSYYPQDMFTAFPECLLFSLDFFVTLRGFAGAVHLSPRWLSVLPPPSIQVCPNNANCPVSVFHLLFYLNMHGALTFVSNGKFLWRAVSV